VGVKFIVDQRCSVKRTLTLTGLIEAVRGRGALRHVTELAAAGMLPAEEIRAACRQCPASLTGRVGGCIADIPYPISEGMEYLLWLTATRALEGELPDPVAGPARSFAEGAMALRQTPFATGLRERGDLLGSRPRTWRKGPVWRARTLTSAQVLDALFCNGLLEGERLLGHASFLRAALAVGEAMGERIADPEQRQAMVEDLKPYADACQLMWIALERDLGVYIWP
jgi:hypothetical protein